MKTFTAPDGTALAYRTLGEGAPLVCLPGGPMQDSRYLAELGGLDAHRRLVLPDLRGTGGSAEPADPASYRCDRQVEDVEALRAHLGLDRIDLLGHSAGANLAVLYAARYPDRIGRLLLVTPSPYALGVAVTPEVRRESARLRAHEPWFPAAYAALEALTEGRGTAADAEAVGPFMHGRWDEAARAFRAAGPAQRNAEAGAVYGGEGAFDPAATRAALAALTAPVLVLAGEWDLNSPPPATAEVARCFPAGRHVLQPGAGHFPWQDDPAAFVATAAAFLA